jgi:uncharacterized membrane protein
MAFCAKCGSAVEAGSPFCSSCGAPQGAASASAAPAGVSAAPVPSTTVAQSGLSENAAGALCYLVGWVTGLVFFLIDKRPYVRFHAVQSIVVFGGLHILLIAFGMFFGFSLFSGGLTGFSVGMMLYSLVNLLALILWVLLMIKASQGSKFRVPVAADIADQLFGKS